MSSRSLKMNTAHYLESLTVARTISTTRLLNLASGHDTSDLTRWGHRRSTTTLTNVQLFWKNNSTSTNDVEFTLKYAYKTPLNLQTRTASKRHEVPRQLLSGELVTRELYTGGSHFRQYFYGVRYLGHPLTCIENFTEIVPGEPLRRRS